MITTGVYNAYDVEYLWDVIYIDYEYEDAIRDLRLQYESDKTIDPEDIDDLIASNLEFFESNRVLYGDWKQDEEGLYKPDHNGPEGFAAIYNRNENTIQVLWSRWIIECGWCSPCYPFQGDVDSRRSDCLAYALPLELMREEWVELNRGRVLDTWEVEV